MQDDACIASTVGSYKHLREPGIAAKRPYASERSLLALGLKKIELGPHGMAARWRDGKRQCGFAGNIRGSEYKWRAACGRELLMLRLAKRARVAGLSPAPRPSDLTDRTSTKMQQSSQVHRCPTLRSTELSSPEEAEHLGVVAVRSTAGAPPRLPAQQRRPDLPPPFHIPCPSLLLIPDSGHSSVSHLPRRPCFSALLRPTHASS